MTTEQCEEILKKSIDQPVKCVEFKTERFSEKAVCLFKEHYQLTIKSTGENSETCTHQYYIKARPATTEKLEDFSDKTDTDKEVAFYKEILPKIGQKQDAFAPNCYLITDEFIVLEDLKPQNFVLNRDFFDYNQWDPLLKSLAKMHTTSILYEESLSTSDVSYRLNNEFEAALKEASFIFEMGHPQGEWLRNNLRATIDCLQFFPGCSEKIEVSNRLLKFVFNRLPNLVQPSKRFRNVINHGNVWKNHVLFKMDERGHSQAVMVDYQLIRYVPPVFDVLTALYLNSERGFLESNFDALLNVYYGYFCTFLKVESVSPEKILPMDVFKSSVEEYKMAAVVVATFSALAGFVSDNLTKEVYTNDQTFQEFTYDDKSKYILAEYQNNHDFKYKFDTMLQRLIDVSLNMHNL